MRGKALEVAIGIDSGMAIRRRAVMFIAQKLLDPAIETLRYAQDDMGWVFDEKRRMKDDERCGRFVFPRKMK